jgi:hypothetical protein
MKIEVEVSFKEENGLDWKDLLLNLAQKVESIMSTVASIQAALTAQTAVITQLQTDVTKANTDLAALLAGATNPGGLPPGMVAVAQTDLNALEASVGVVTGNLAALDAATVAADTKPTPAS